MLTEHQEFKDTADNRINEIGSNIAVNVSLAKENEESNKKNLDKLLQLEEKITNLELQSTSQQASSDQPSTSTATTSGSSLETVTRIVERHLGNYDLQLAAHDLKFQVNLMRKCTQSY